MTNEYQPWKADGVTEGEYWARRYIEVSMEFARVRALIPKIVEAAHLTGTDCATDADYKELYIRLVEVGAECPSELLPQILRDEEYRREHPP